MLSGTERYRLVHGLVRLDDDRPDEIKSLSDASAKMAQALANWIFANPLDVPFAESIRELLVELFVAAGPVVFENELYAENIMRANAALLIESAEGTVDREFYHRTRNQHRLIFGKEM